MSKKSVISFLGVAVFIFIFGFIYSEVTSGANGDYGLVTLENGVEGLDAKQKEMYIKMENELTNLRTNIVHDFQKNYELDFDKYKQVSLEELFKHGLYYKFASVIMSDIMAKQSQGDAEPIVFINEKENEALILEKKSNGENHLHTYHYDEEWKQVSKEVKQGTKITEKYYESIIE